MLASQTPLHLQLLRPRLQNKSVAKVQTPAQCLANSRPPMRYKSSSSTPSHLPQHPPVHIPNQLPSQLPSHLPSQLLSHLPRRLLSHLQGCHPTSQHSNQSRRLQHLLRTWMLCTLCRYVANHTSIWRSEKVCLKTTCLVHNTVRYHDMQSVMLSDLLHDRQKSYTVLAGKHDGNPTAKHGISNQHTSYPKKQFLIGKLEPCLLGFMSNASPDLLVAFFTEQYSK